MCVCAHLSVHLVLEKNFTNQKVELRKREGKKNKPSNFVLEQRGDSSVCQTEIRCKIQVIGGELT